MARIPRVISASQSMLLRFGDPLDERQNSAENGLRWFVWYRKTNRVGKGDFSYSKQIIIYNIIIFLSTELRRWVGRRKEIVKLTFKRWLNAIRFDEGLTLEAPASETL